MKFTEEKLKLYAAPLSDTENEKCKRAIDEIRKALKGVSYTDDNKEISTLVSNTNSYSISMRSIQGSERLTIFLQGSYANNTCVRGESDVDIAIVREDLAEYTYGTVFKTNKSKRVEAHALKAVIERALKQYFSNSSVKRGNKSILVNGNTYRKQADVVPCMSTKYALSEYSTYDKSGIVIYADDGGIIYNFPKYHIQNGKIKNNSTNLYYKKMVRIVKKMRYLMSEEGYDSADKVSSFGLESLLWNIPNDIFMLYNTYKEKFNAIVRYMYINSSKFAFYKEANGIKPLCPTKNEVDIYTAFVRELYLFYVYEA